MPNYSRWRCCYSVWFCPVSADTEMCSPVHPSDWIMFPCGRLSRLLALFWQSHPACPCLIFLCAAVLSAAALWVPGGPAECQRAAEDRRPVHVEHVGKHPRAGTLFPSPRLPWPFNQLLFNTQPSLLTPHTISPSVRVRYLINPAIHRMVDEVLEYDRDWKSEIFTKCCDSTIYNCLLYVKNKTCL